MLFLRYIPKTIDNMAASTSKKSIFDIFIFFERKPIKTLPTTVESQKKDNICPDRLSEKDLFNLRKVGNHVEMPDSVDT